MRATTCQVSDISRVEDASDFRQPAVAATGAGAVEGTEAGGAEVLISWSDREDDFDLYVYKGTELVGDSANSDTTSERVFIPSANRDEGIFTSARTHTRSNRRWTSSAIAQPAKSAASA